MTKRNIKKTILPILLLTIFLIVIQKCSFHAIPKEKLQFFNLPIEESYDNGEYRLLIKNPVHCPNRIYLSCQDEEINDLLKGYAPLVLAAKADTTISIKGKGNLKGKINLKLKFGDPTLPIGTKNITSLPFPKGKSYELLQGNNSNPTHNHNLSRYAFDFTMAIGDTVSSAQNGYVIGVIDGYKGWGYSSKWKSYSNQVMIYDTTSHLFTMYGHLKQHSRLVEMGEYVTIGQPIALSGQTGQTSEEHLHFNVLKPDSKKGNLISYPLDSIGNYKVKDLKRYQMMKH